MNKQAGEGTDDRVETVKYVEIFNSGRTGQLIRLAGAWNLNVGGGVLTLLEEQVKNWNPGNTQEMHKFRSEGGGPGYNPSTFKDEQAERKQRLCGIK